jgi:hypothetical protein
MRDFHSSSALLDSRSNLRQCQPPRHILTFYSVRSLVFKHAGNVIGYFNNLSGDSEKCKGPNCGRYLLAPSEQRQPFDGVKAKNWSPNYYEHPPASGFNMREQEKIEYFKNGRRLAFSRTKTRAFLHVYVYGQGWPTTAVSRRLLEGTKISLPCLID